MEEMDVIDRFLDIFISYIDSGFGLLQGDIAYLTSTLIVIDVTLAGLFWAGVFYLFHHYLHELFG